MTSLPLPLCIAMESTLNGLLSLDEYSRENARPLTGKTIKIELTDLSLAFYLSISNRQHVMILSYAEDPDVVIHATSINLAKMSTMEDANRMVLNQEVNISGDVSTVSQVQAFFSSIHIDWEEHLSRLTGDMIAHKIGNIVRDGVSWLQSSSKSLLDDVSEYVRYEAEWLPDDHENQVFISQVNQLRNDVDRLEARIKRLVHQMHAKNNKGTTS